MRKSQRRPPQLSRRAAAEQAAESANDQLSYRTLELRASTLNAEERSIEAIVSTETPVPMIDWERYEVIPEVLLTKGCELPKSRQVPLLDSHMRYSEENQLGSTRELRHDAAGVVGRNHFSETAERAWTKVREGHLSDVSAGYQVLKKTYVEAGKKKSINGREYEGPVNVVTKWRLREVSVTPIGADELAKMRGFDPAALPSPPVKNAEKFAMNKALRALLESRGMPATLTDDEAQAWLVEHKERLLVPENAPAPAPAPVRAENQLDEAKIATLVADGIRQFEERQAKARESFRKDVDELTELADCVDLRSECYNLPDVAAVRAHLQKQKAERASTIPAPRVRFGDHQPAQRLLEGMQTALTLRALTGVATSDEAAMQDELGGRASERRAKVIERIFPTAKRSKDADDFRHASLYDMARECVELEGYDTRGRSREDIAITALGFANSVGMERRSGAIHTTGSFPKLTQDAMHKSMQVGYAEFPATWRGPMRQGTSVSDFKQIHRMRLGAVPNLPQWPTSQDPNRVKLKDADEPYAVECYSVGLDFDFKVLINDDMNVISRAPSLLGIAAGRTVNAFAWSIITANATMGDGVALFAAATGNRKRTNLTTGAGAPAVATLQTLTNLMMQMRGENTPENAESDDILALQPKYIAGPSALRTTILQLVLSVYDPASANMIYNTASELIPVIEPRLDAASTTAWYLFADSNQADTVEITFLVGHETPQTRMVADEHKLCQTHYVLQTFGGKALDHRGMQKHAGA